jgi:hypothetical protein
MNQLLDTDNQQEHKKNSNKNILFPKAVNSDCACQNEGVNGMCKLLLAEDDTVLGAHVLGNPASEIITLAGDSPVTHTVFLAQNGMYRHFRLAYSSMCQQRESG